MTEETKINKYLRFLKYYKPHKKLFIIDFASAFLMAIIDLVFPVFTKNIIDDIIPNKNFRMFYIIILILLVFQIIKTVLQYIVIHWGHVLGLRIEYNMRKDLYNHLQKLSLSYYDNTKKGDIINRITGDLNNISELAHHGPEDLFIAIITLVGSFFLMLNMNVKLTFIVFALVPFFIWFTLKYNDKMKKGFKNVKQKNSEMSSEVEDTISGVRVIKAFAKEDYAKERFDKSNSNLLNSFGGVFRVMGSLYAGLSLFTGLIQLVVLWFGGIMIFHGEISTGILVGFFLFVGKFLEPIRKIMFLLELYQGGMAGYDRFVQIMEIEPDIEDKPDAKELKIRKGEINFAKVNFSYNEDSNCILNDFSLNIKASETVALVGSSGVGKSTICSLIPRFYDVNSGSITIDNQDIKDVTQDSIRKNVGIVQQDVFLFNGSIKENIAFGNEEATEEEIIHAAKLANAHEFILHLKEGYDTHVGERGIKLSGGQKQRIAIARIFLKNPKILLLDEATSALDNKTESLIQKSLNELTKGRTTIVIAHRLSTVKNAHRIVVIGKDGIIEEGTHEKLLELNGDYAKLYKAQFHGYIPDEV